MNVIGLVIFMLVIACTSAAAEENTADALDNAKYHVTDILNPQNDRLELWDKQDVPVQEEESFHYKITKRVFGSKIVETEIHTEWFTESRPGDDTNYLKMRFAAHPVTLEPGQRSFGHVEEIGPGAQAHKWPMFYKMEAVGKIRRTSFVVMIPNGHKWHIIKEYEDGMYHFPRKEENIIRLGGNVVEHTIHERSN